MGISARPRRSPEISREEKNDLNVSNQNKKLSFGNHVHNIFLEGSHSHQRGSARQRKEGPITDFTEKPKEKHGFPLEKPKNLRENTTFHMKKTKNL